MTTRTNECERHDCLNKKAVCVCEDKVRHLLKSSRNAERTLTKIFANREFFFEDERNLRFLEDTVIALRIVISRMEAES